MHATKPQVFNYFCLPWREAGVEGEGDKIKHSSKSPATAFYVGTVSIREGSLKHRASGCPAAKSSRRAPVCCKRGNPLSKVGGRDSGWPRPHVLESAQEESNILPTFRCVWSRYLCLIHSLQAFLMASRGMQISVRAWFVWHLFQVSSLGLNDSHPEYITHWLKRDYSMSVLQIRIFLKEPIWHHKISLWQLPSAIIVGHWDLYGFAHPTGKGKDRKPETFIPMNKILTLQSKWVNFHCNKEEWQGLSTQIMQFHR